MSLAALRRAALARDDPGLLEALDRDAYDLAPESPEAAFERLHSVRARGLDRPAVRFVGDEDGEHRASDWIMRQEEEG